MQILGGIQYSPWFYRSMKLGIEVEFAINSTSKSFHVIIAGLWHQEEQSSIIIVLVIIWETTSPTATYISSPLAMLYIHENNILIIEIKINSNVVLTLYWKQNGWIYKYSCRTLQWASTGFSSWTPLNVKPYYGYPTNSKVTLHFKRLMEVSQEEYNSLPYAKSKWITDMKFCLYLINKELLNTPIHLCHIILLTAYKLKGFGDNSMSDANKI